MRTLCVAAVAAFALTACKTTERYVVRDQFFAANQNLMTYTQTADELVPYVTAELKGRSFEVENNKAAPDGLTITSTKREVRGTAGGTAGIGVDKQDWWEVQIKDTDGKRQVIAIYKSYGRMAKNTDQRLPTFEFGVLKRVDPERAKGLDNAWPAFATEKGVSDGAELVPEVDRARDQLN